MNFLRRHSWTKAMRAGRLRSNLEKCKCSHVSIQSESRDASSKRLIEERCGEGKIRLKTKNGWPAGEQFVPLLASQAPGSFGEMRILVVTPWFTGIINHRWDIDCLGDSRRMHKFQTSTQRRPIPPLAAGAPVAAHNSFVLHHLVVVMRASLLHMLHWPFPARRFTDMLLHLSHHRRFNLFLFLFWFLFLFLSLFLVRRRLRRDRLLRCNAGVSIFVHCIGCVIAYFVVKRIAKLALQTEVPRVEEDTGKA